MESKQELIYLLQELEKRNGKLYFDWVKDYWTSRGEPLDFYYHKYLQQIYTDQHPDIVYKKSAQSGFSERMVTEAFWLADQFRENAIYFFPTTGTITDFVQDRVDEPINNNDYLSSVTGRIKKDGKQADKVGLKRMSKGFVYLRGAQKKNQVKSVAGDVVFIDEVDEIEEWILPFIYKRLEHSKRKWKRTASTPSIPNIGIDRLYNESDKTSCWVKCNHCNKQQILTFWDNIDQDRELLVCSKCKKQIKVWECDLEWISERDSDTRGYYINQLYSPLVNIKDLIKESRKTSESEIQQFYNQNLGLAYEPKGSKLTEEDIAACTRDYSIPLKEENAFMGVDVGRTLHYVILGEKRLLHTGDVKSFDELSRIMNDFNIKKCVIDALPETREVQKFCDNFMGRALMCYYSGFKEVKDEIYFKIEKQKINTDRTISLDKSTDDIKQQKIEFPKNIYGYEEFRNHLKNLIRVVTEDKVKAKAEWVKIGDDHYRHALNYATLAKRAYKNTAIVEAFVL